MTTNTGGHDPQAISMVRKTTLLDNGRVAGNRYEIVYHNQTTQFIREEEYLEILQSAEYRGQTFRKVQNPGTRKRPPKSETKPSKAGGADPG